MMSKTNLIILLISLFSFTFFLLQISDPASKLWKDHLSKKVTNVIIKRPKQVYHNEKNYTKSFNKIPSVEGHITFENIRDMNNEIGNTSKHKNVLLYSVTVWSKTAP